MCGITHESCSCIVHRAFYDAVDHPPQRHAKILAKSMEVTQRIGVRLLDAARLLVDKEIYLQTNVGLTLGALQTTEDALKSIQDRANETAEITFLPASSAFIVLEYWKESVAANETAAHFQKEFDSTHETKLKAETAHKAAVRQLELHSAILENDHHQRMDLPQLKRARKLLGQTWEFCLLDSSEVNAFVHALQPRRIFVNVPLIVLARSEDELAMVLAHEISHALCGHTEQAQTLTLFKAAAVAFLFSMVDPTGRSKSL